MAANDGVALVAGAVAWGAAVPIVKAAGPVVARGSTAAKCGMLVVCLGIAAATTPLLSKALGWQTRAERVRGVALALGAAQTIDGLVHFFKPGFYSADSAVAVGAAGSIFAGAGLLGIFSAYA